MHYEEYIYIYIYFKKIYLKCFHYKVKNNKNKIIQTYTGQTELKFIQAYIFYSNSIHLINKEPKLIRTELKHVHE
jgi:hypothetical protein